MQKTCKEVKLELITLELTLDQYVNRLTSCLYGTTETAVNRFVGFTEVQIVPSLNYAKDGIHFNIFIDYMAPVGNDGRKIIPVNLFTHSHDEVMREVKQTVTNVLRLYKCQTGMSYKTASYGNRATQDDRRNVYCARRHRARKQRRW